MAYAIKCKTCGRISRKNYLFKKTAERAGMSREYAACREKQHRLEIEKVY